MFVLIATVTAAYLYYIKKERQSSIDLYAGRPRTGDIYKVQTDTREEGVRVFYLRVKDIGAQSVYFSPSRLTTASISDLLLRAFDTSQTMVFTKNELAAIAAGQWRVPDKENLQLLEIERK